MADDHMQTCRGCGRRFRLRPLLDLPQPSRCMECLIKLDASEDAWAAKLAAAEARAEEATSRGRGSVSFHVTTTEAMAGIEMMTVYGGVPGTTIAEVFANLVGQRDALAARLADLERQRTEMDCRFAGKYAEMSGSHCPTERPCDRCASEREVRMWEGANAKLIDRAEDLASQLARAEEALRETATHLCVLLQMGYVMTCGSAKAIGPCGPCRARAYFAALAPGEKEEDRG